MVDFKLVSSEECRNCISMIKNLVNNIQMASFIPPTKPANPGILPAAAPSKYPVDKWVEELSKYPIAKSPPGYNGVFNIDDTKPIKKPKKIDEYPSTCPRCKGKCYIGLYEIKHENQIRDSNCR